MHIGHGALRRMRRQILPQPLFLGRSGLAAADARTVGIQHDDVPAGIVVAIIALGGLAGRGAEVVVIAACSYSVIFVISDRGPRPRFMPAPRRLVAVRKLSAGTVVVNIIAGGKDETGDRVEQI